MLIFAPVAERYAEIIADRRINVENQIGDLGQRHFDADFSDQGRAPRRRRLPAQRLGFANAYSLPFGARLDVISPRERRWLVRTAITTPTRCEPATLQPGADVVLLTAFERTVDPKPPSRVPASWHRR